MRLDFAALKTFMPESCRPREGCGLRLVPMDQIDEVKRVAVPVRGAGCVLP